MHVPRRFGWKTDTNDLDLGGSEVGSAEMPVEPSARLMGAQRMRRNSRRLITSTVIQTGDRRPCKTSHTMLLLERE